MTDKITICIDRKSQEVCDIITDVGRTRKKRAAYALGKDGVFAARHTKGFYIKKFFRCLCAAIREEWDEMIDRIVGCSEMDDCYEC